MLKTWTLFCDLAGRSWYQREEADLKYQVQILISSVTIQVRNVELQWVMGNSNLLDLSIVQPLWGVIHGNRHHKTIMHSVDGICATPSTRNYTARLIINYWDLMETYRYWILATELIAIRTPWVCNGVSNQEKAHSFRDSKRTGLEEPAPISCAMDDQGIKVLQSFCTCLILRSMFRNEHCVMCWM